MSLSGTISEIFIVELWRALQIWIIGVIQGHWKWHYSIDRL